MTYNIKKIIKGTLAIFTIKLILIGSIIIFQSCQTENIDENDEISSTEKKSFLESLHETRERIIDIPIIKQTKTNQAETSRLSPDSYLSFCIQTIDGQFVSTPINNSLNRIDGQPVSSKISNFINRLPSFQSLLQNEIQKNTLLEAAPTNNTTTNTSLNVNTTITNETTPFDTSNCTFIIQISLETINSAIDPSIQTAKDFLLSRDLTDNDILEILDGEDDSALVPLVHGIITVEEEAESLTTIINPLSILGIHTANAQSWGTISGCAVSALGLDSLTTLRDALQGKKITGRALKRAAKKVVKKFAAGLSGWGTMIMVAEFAICAAMGD
ncbi:hypothetical protein [Olleya sp. 1-3]|uniref:hypothetical protein n=1 Tax=Olleya sp. 1-3 TaxID=2058323 RepID=UPI000C34FBF8|nr:hypothetical protein [Olleya sp. 1-3]PKG49704.1 hypothetical protein CXF54_13350 [Olleya sp. 1-3]